MQAKDKEIALLQQQLGGKVSHEWYTLNSLTNQYSSNVTHCMCGNYKHVSKNYSTVFLHSKATKITVQLWQQDY